MLKSQVNYMFRANKISQYYYVLKVEHNIRYLDFQYFWNIYTNYVNPTP